MELLCELTDQTVLGLPGRSDLRARDAAALKAFPDAAI